MITPATSQFWSIAVDAPLAGPLTYSVPEELAGHLKRGQMVHLPLGRRQARGVLLNSIADKPTMTLKNISSLEMEYKALPEFFLSWLEWVSQYYFFPVGSVLSLAYPPLKKAKKENSQRKRSAIPDVSKTVPPTLTAEQNKIISSISSFTGFSTHLVFGVTGSGKTEVYMRLLEEVLQKQKRGLVLVPEISLTPQLIQRFVARFGNQVAVMHSQLTERERTNQWWDIVEGRKSILIGARSALFCPIEELDLIIVDEEHEPSYKQEEKLKYHGRDCAIMLGKFAHCRVVLGSATPSLESWKNAVEGKYHLHEMRERVEGRPLPEVQIVDLRAIDKSEQSVDVPKWLSPLLYAEIQNSLEKKHQVALFLNRRGVSPLVLCQSCGFTYECPNCDINLTLHGKSHLVCHYCAYHQNLGENCPDCKEGEVVPIGLGTEMLETEMKRLFPGARVARADRDEISNRLELENLISKMENQEIDILVGTQMIAKGLDFPKLNLVGLILADIGFNIPDFRSTERSFQLVTQVSGRAGRHVQEGEDSGKVIIQTFNPDHPSLVFSVKADFRGFAESEMSNRSALHYPPFGRVISIRLQGPQLTNVQSAANKMAELAQQLKSSKEIYEKIEVLGPASSPIARVRGQFRYHLLLKGQDTKPLNQFIRHLLKDESWVPSSVRIIVDIDPLNLL